MHIQEIEWNPSPPKENPVYEKTVKSVRRCCEAKETIRREWEAAAEFLADCTLLPPALKEKIRLYYTDVLAAISAEYSRSRERLLALGYDDYD